ncbi:MAG: hypothetical protein EXS48_02985 [Candidatus Staskawiczbacteria bacterium]|nr:hypothetical protein [Candidatus Staskawiczbacteria bacterium]
MKIECFFCGVRFETRSELVKHDCEDRDREAPSQPRKNPYRSILAKWDARTALVKVLVAGEKPAGRRV